MTTLHAPVSAAQPLLLSYTLPITELDARVRSRTPGYWSQDDEAEPTAFVEVSGRCGGSPFVARVTVVGWEGSERLFKGSAQDVADEARWHLEPFLGELSAAQIAAIVEEVTDAAKGAL
ncbi:MAG: hypothetical protein RIR41_1625 [Pseudomonadota bacterium]|jgi:hypothetical protein